MKKWIINFAVVQFTPPAIANIGWRTYIIFAVLNTAFLPVIYIFYPETKGMQLEDVDRLFSKTGEFERESIREKGVVEHVEEMNV